jgi:hypothetical protein
MSRHGQQYIAEREQAASVFFPRKAVITSEYVFVEASAHAENF